MGSEHAVVRKAIAASAIGNATEWFDYGIYAYGVTYISAAIFPGRHAERDPARADDVRRLVPGAATRRTVSGVRWATVRPQARAGDHDPVDVRRDRVRRPVPSYDAIGLWAPILLVLLRMIQGFSTGGEYGGAATFMAEYAPGRRRGFCGSFLEFGTLAGFSLGALLMLGFSLAARRRRDARVGLALPFLVAAPLGLVGIYLRSRLRGHAGLPRSRGEGREGGGDHGQLKDLLTDYRRTGAAAWADWSSR